MLENVDAVEFVRRMANGKTGPSLLVCETSTGDFIEVVAKFSNGCEQGVSSLAAEVVAACLAADLGLPIPKPYLVNASTEFIFSVPDAEQRSRMQNSNPIAFGSTHITGQYSAWISGSVISDAMQGEAAAILAFDGIIQNSDRRDANPNCLMRGENLRIFDHELCFAHGIILGWRPPWSPGGLEVLCQPGFHIFRKALRGRPVDLTPIRLAWESLTDDRILSYGQAIPIGWTAATNSVASALQLIKDARDNIDACIAEIERVLQ